VAQSNLCIAIHGSHDTCNHLQHTCKTNRTRVSLVHWWICCSESSARLTTIVTECLLQSNEVTVWVLCICLHSAIENSMFCWGYSWTQYTPLVNNISHYCPGKTPICYNLQQIDNMLRAQLGDYRCVRVWTLSNTAHIWVLFLWCTTCVISDKSHNLSVPKILIYKLSRVKVPTLRSLYGLK
jgi:hypothetical protein